MGRRYEITNQNNHNLAEAVMEVLNENGFEGFAEAFHIEKGVCHYRLR